MLWTVLFQKLKRQPPKASQIYALLDNPKTHRTEKVYLKLKYDSHGYPYFVPIDENIERGYRKTNPGGASSIPFSYCKYRPQKDLHFLFFTVFLILSVSDQ